MVNHNYVLFLDLGVREFSSEMSHKIHLNLSANALVVMLF